MKIAVHIDPQSELVMGLWTINTEGGLNSFYPGGTKFPFQLGKQKMDEWSEYKPFSWDLWCEQLAGRTPVKVWWEVAESTANETLEEAYRRLTSK